MAKNKLKISISFDDGRKDTYDVAYKIMKKYNLVGTIHVITSYVDGSYEKNDIDGSYGSCTWSNLKELKKYGFEISMHGDQHITDIDDLKKCRDKLLANDLVDSVLGFSVPHSKEDILDTDDFKKYADNNLNYIRVGKNNNKLSFIKKVEYFFYQYLKIKSMFWIYNRININDLDNYDKYRIYSVVIKRNTELYELKKMIEKNFDTNNWIVFMFHSVSEINNKSIWSFDAKKFESFCIYLSQLMKENKITVETISDVING